MTVVGIDPGLDGGLAAIGPEGLTLQIMPTLALGKKRVIDERQLCNSLMTFRPPETMVFIEAVSARPGQGVVSMFSFGLSFGLLRGICLGLGLPYELVRPQEWQKTMLMGQPKGSEYLVASRLWPNAEWLATPRSQKPHPGLVDAALIAEYGKRRR